MRSEDFISAVKRSSDILTIPRITFLAWANGARNYLEIGVNTGATFLNVHFRRKVAVDPVFKFDTRAAAAKNTFLYEIPSDGFFGKLKEKSPDTAPLYDDASGEPPVFDVIFIDGLHTFEQSFRDFENSLAYAGDKTFWILDDTVPSDAYSALGDISFASRVRKKAGFCDDSWHGDVYKTVFAIHDKYPEYSYCTLMGRNPQTVVWKTGHTGRKPLFPSLEAIDALGYFDMIRHANVMMPVADTALPEILGKPVDPSSIAPEQVWERLIYTRITTVGTYQR